MGPAVLEVATGNENKENKENIEYARTIVMVCIISILLTAPTGAIIVSLSGSKLLTKAKPSNEQSWRRGPRPSIRDITLNSDDEGDDEDDDGTYASNNDRAECDRTKTESSAVTPVDVEVLQNERI